LKIPAEYQGADIAYKIESNLTSNQIGFSKLSISYEEVPTVSDPTINIDADNNKATISIPDGTEVWYTTDGTTPAKNGSTSKKYTEDEAIAITHDMISIAAIAYDANGNASNVTTVTVSYKSSVEAPAISTNGNEVTITATEGLTVYYTIDGSTPSNESTQYTKPFEIAEDCTVKAIAYNSNNDMSGVTVTDVPYCKVATPIFTPSSTYVEAGTAVTIACATEGATIYYTLNGGEALEYTNATAITVNEATTLTAYATLAHYAQSETATQSYKIGTLVEKASTLNTTTLGNISGTDYAERSYTDEATGAAYLTSANGIDSTKPSPAFGIKSENGGIVTTKSPGTVSKITLTQYTKQTAKRSVNIYGSHTAYTSYAKANIEKTTKLNGDDAITLTSGSAVTFDLSTLSDFYEYIAIIPAVTNATQISEIQIVWNVLGDNGTNEPEQPEQPEEPASKEIEFDFSTSNSMSNGNITLDFTGEYDAEYGAYLASGTGINEIKSFTDTDETIGIKSIAFTVKNPTENDEFAYQFEANDDNYVVTPTNKFNDEWEFVSHNAAEVGTFNIDDNGNLSWSAKNEDDLINSFTFENPNQVVISKVNITWDYVQPVFMSCKIDGTTVNFSTLKGHKVYYRTVATPADATAPSQVASRRVLDSDEEDDTDTTIGATDNADYRAVENNVAGWEVNGSQYVCDLSSLAAGQSYEIKIENATKSIVKAFGKDINNEVVTGLENVTITTANDVEEWYTLQGVRVANPAAGIFIHRVGNRVEKVVVK
jgi:hypothetical protein